MIRIAFLLIFGFFFIACQKEESSVFEDPLLKKDYSITYQYPGVNLLYIPDSTTIISGDYYTLSATLGKDAELKIVMTNLSTTSALWFYSPQDHFTVSPYKKGVQEFTTTKDGLNIMTLKFSQGTGPLGGFGTCRIDIYENSPVVTKSKVVFW